MKAIKFFVFCGLVLFFSCTTKNEVSHFYINLDVVIKQSDSIRVFYKKNGKIDFNEIEAFWTKVHGSKKNQKIVLKFPNNIVPNQFRIDLGNNPKQEEIVLNKMECSYKTKSFVLKGKEIYKVLRVDDSNTILEKDLGNLKRKDLTKKNGPSLYPNGDFLRKKLETLTSNTQ